MTVRAGDEHSPSRASLDRAAVVRVPYLPPPIPSPDDPNRFEIVADRLGHGAAATAVMAAGLRRQIELDTISRDEILKALEAIAAEAATAHALAASAFVGDSKYRCGDS